MNRPYNVLFLCTGNAGRSLIGEAVFNRIGRENFRAFSAGSQPRAAAHPAALRLLTSLGYDTEGLQPKSWNEFARSDSPPLDFVFTVCDNVAGEVCPVWPGQPITEHWGVPDPTAGTRSDAELDAAFAETYRLLHDKISAFCALPIESLDHLSLQRRLREIGAPSSA